MQYALDHFVGDFRLDLLQDVAGKVEPSQSTIHGYAEYRQLSATLSNLDYIAPSPSSIPSELNKLYKFIQESGFHPLEEASILYFHLARIQPFREGNKRTATIMMDTTLNYHGYPAVSINPNDKDSFLSLFRSAINGYRQSMSQGERLSRYTVSNEEKSLFNWFTNKVLHKLTLTEHNLNNLDNWVIELDTKYPGAEFTAEKAMRGHFRKHNGDHPYQTNLDRRKHQLRINGNITYATIKKILSDIKGLKFTIYDKRDL